VELITAIGHKLGLPVNIVTIPFDSLFDALAAGRFDLAISGITVTPERQQNFSFVEYIVVGESLLVSKGNPHNIQSLADLCGSSVGVLAGTTEEAELTNQSMACVASGKPGINIVFGNDTTAPALLTTGRVNATFQDSTDTDFIIHQNPGQFESLPVINPRPEGIMFPKNSTFLINIVTLGLTSVQVDGTYHQLIGKWGLTQEALATPFNCTTQQ